MIQGSSDQPRVTGTSPPTGADKTENLKQTRASQVGRKSLSETASSATTSVISAKNLQETSPKDSLKKYEAAKQGILSSIQKGKPQEARAKLDALSGALLEEGVSLRETFKGYSEDSFKKLEQDVAQLRKDWGGASHVHVNESLKKELSLLGLAIADVHRNKRGALKEPIKHAKDALKTVSDGMSPKKTPSTEDLERYESLLNKYECTLMLNKDTAKSAAALRKQIYEKLGKDSPSVTWKTTPQATESDKAQNTSSSAQKSGSSVLDRIKRSVSSFFGRLSTPRGPKEDIPPHKEDIPPPPPYEEDIPPPPNAQPPLAPYRELHKQNMKDLNALLNQAEKIQYKKIFTSYNYHANKLIKSLEEWEGSKSVNLPVGAFKADAKGALEDLESWVSGLKVEGSTRLPIEEHVEQYKEWVRQLEEPPKKPQSR